MALISPDWRPTARDDLLRETQGEEQVVLVPGTKEVHLLNLSAAAILELCDGTLSVREMVRALQEALKADLAEIEADVHKTLSEFLEKGFLGL